MLTHGITVVHAAPAGTGTEKQRQTSTQNQTQKSTRTWLRSRTQNSQRHTRESLGTRDEACSCASNRRFVSSAFCSSERLSTRAHRTNKRSSHQLQCHRGFVVFVILSLDHLSVGARPQKLHHGVSTLGEGFLSVNLVPWIRLSPGHTRQQLRVDTRFAGRSAHKDNSHTRETHACYQSRLGSVRLHLRPAEGLLAFWAFAPTPRRLRLHKPAADLAGRRSEACVDGESLTPRPRCPAWAQS